MASVIVVHVIYSIIFSQSNQTGLDKKSRAWLLYIDKQSFSVNQSNTDLNNKVASKLPLRSVHTLTVNTYGYSFIRAASVRVSIKRNEASQRKPLALCIVPSSPTLSKKKQRKTILLQFLSSIEEEVGRSYHIIIDKFHLSMMMMMWFCPSNPMPVRPVTDPGATHSLPACRSLLLLPKACR